MIVYNRLWETMKEKGISQYRLYTEYQISKSLIQRLRENKGVSTHTIDTLCNILDCEVYDIMEHVKIENKQSEKEE